MLRRYDNINLRPIICRSSFFRPDSVFLFVSSVVLARLELGLARFIFNQISPSSSQASNHSQVSSAGGYSVPGGHLREDERNSLALDVEVQNLRLVDIGRKVSFTSNAY